MKSITRSGMKPITTRSEATRGGDPAILIYDRFTAEGRAKRSELIKALAHAKKYRNRYSDEEPPMHWVPFSCGVQLSLPARYRAERPEKAAAGQAAPHGAGRQAARASSAEVDPAARCGTISSCRAIVQVGARAVRGALGPAAPRREASRRRGEPAGVGRTAPPAAGNSAMGGRSARSVPGGGVSGAGAYWAAGRW